MRSIANFITAVLAAMATMTWELINGTWKLVRSLVVPQPPRVNPASAPVSAAQAAADAILAANDSVKAERQRGHDGMTHRFPLGYAVAMAACGVEDHLVDVPEQVATWTLALTASEKAALARFRPDEIEAHLNAQRRLPGVPAYGQVFEQVLGMLSHNIRQPEPEVVEPIYRGPRFA